MRRLSRRRPMKLQGFSVSFLQFSLHCDRNMWLTSVAVLTAGLHHTFYNVRSRLLWGFLFELVKQAEHIFIIWCSCKGSLAGSDEKSGLDGHLWQFRSDYLERYWIRSDSKGNDFTHHCSITVPANICTTFFFSRWHWRSDGAVYRSQCFNNIGNIWLPIRGKAMAFTLLKLKLPLFYHWFLIFMTQQ